MTYRTNLILEMNEANIPARMQGGLARFIIDGVMPGNFLVAVLSNNLTRAVSRADDENLTLLRNYVQFLYGHAPDSCWGSDAKVDAWRGLAAVGVAAD